MCNCQPKRTAAEIERLFQANKFYYELGDGVAWSLPLVSFKSQDSAKKFKKVYPELIVQFQVQPPPYTSYNRA
jgi:hypothetical protein